MQIQDTKEDQLEHRISWIWLSPRAPLSNILRTQKQNLSHTIIIVLVTFENQCSTQLQALLFQQLLPKVVLQQDIKRIKAWTKLLCISK